MPKELFKNQEEGVGTPTAPETPAEPETPKETPEEEAEEPEESVGGDIG